MPLFHPLNSLYMRADTRYLHLNGGIWIRGGLSAIFYSVQKSFKALYMKEKEVLSSLDAEPVIEGPGSE